MIRELFSFEVRPSAKARTEADSLREWKKKQVQKQGHKQIACGKGEGVSGSGLFGEGVDAAL
jgi:hypothetical protein